MHHTLRKSVGLAACALALRAAPARAEIDVEVFAGGHFFNGDGKLGRSGLPAAAYAPNSALQPAAALFGLRLAYLPIPRVAVEGELGISPTETARNIYGAADGAPVHQTQYQVVVMPLRVHALVNLLTGRFRPFVLAGGGIHIASPIGLGSIATDVVGALHLGAGFKVDVGREWGLRLDGRGVFPQGREKVLTAEGEVLGSVFARFDIQPPAPPPAPPAPAAEAAPKP